MDFRLVATDMDGTLLNTHHEVPEKFWDILEQMRAKGIAFAPASGRQLATLQKQFGHAGEPISYIAENGTVVVHDGEIISLTTIDSDTVHSIIDAVRASDIDMGVVVCRPERAYVERNDEAFRAEGLKYYVSIEEVQDLHEAVNNEVIKVAIFTFQDAEKDCAPIIRAASPNANVVVSGQHWVDVMDPSANKGQALATLRDALGLEESQTLVFGDYLNDTELIKAAGKSYAMSNAHPDILELADEIAPSNIEEGVIVVLEKLLNG
ncbi:MAG: Cof-type HAD-IIB family hydrolase [Corynebacterium glutamicum]|nr:Cof-type HAD-IIB family hydrolase [Corynebacterium glutamicum]